MTGTATRPAVLLERHDVSSRLAVFRFGAGGSGAALPPFEAGQHVRLAIPTAAGGWSGRPLSIASAPEETRWIEFCVRRSGSGADLFVERLFSLRPGAPVRLGARGEGALTLRDTVAPGDPRAFLMIAAGTGVAPFASIVRSLAARGEAERLARIAVLHGVSIPEDLVYRGLFREALGVSRFRPAVSRPNRVAGPGWAAGRVETMLAPGRVEATERAIGLVPGAIVPERVAVFVCGFPGTVAAVARHLEPRGYSRDGRALFTEA